MAVSSVDLITTLINNFTENSKLTQHISTCICGCKLQMVQIESIATYTCVCDVCYKTMGNDDTFWHCPNEYNIKHPEGFSICSTCDVFDTHVMHLETTSNFERQPANSVFCGQSGKCEALEKFMVVMKHYNQNHVKFVQNTDKAKLIDICDYYLHIINEHNDDEQFQTIVNDLGHCNVANCHPFRRNNRHRIQTNGLKCDIICKVDNDTKSCSSCKHNKATKKCGGCKSVYYCSQKCQADHWKDHKAECKKIRKSKSNKKTKKAMNASFASNLKKHYKKENKKRHTSYDFKMNIMDNMHCYFHHCYDLGYRLPFTLTEAMNEHKVEVNDVFTEHYLNKNRHEITKIIQKKKQKLGKIYPGLDNNISGQYSKSGLAKFAHFSFGHQRTYDFEGNTEPPKYQSFKEELLNNKFAVLTIAQYDSELCKAYILFNSQYCKSNEDLQRRNDKELQFTVDYLLAMMIYCNYTLLQCEFSKTYRDACDNLAFDMPTFINPTEWSNNHTEFYHLGKYLKICIMYFGTVASPRNGKKFYHGISESLVLDQWMIGVADCGEQEGIKLNCPVSTTTSFPVAVHFATDNGMVLELQLNASQGENYLSLEWVSDYGNEKEHLFLAMPTVITSNIIELKTGYEYGIILRATKALKELAKGNYDDPDLRDDDTQVLLSAIIEDYLSWKKVHGYRPFASLTKYGRELVHSVLGGGGWMIGRFVLHYWKLHKYCKHLSRFFVHSETEVPKLDVIMALSKEVGDIVIHNVKLSHDLFESIVEFLETLEKDDQPSNILIYNPNVTCSMLTMEDAMNIYSTRLRKTNAFIAISDYKWNKVVISRREPLFISSIAGFFASDDSDDPYDCSNRLKVNDETALWAKKMLLNQLAQSHEFTFEDLENFDSASVRLNRVCSMVSAIVIDSSSFLYEIIVHESIDGWIRLDKLKKLFPMLISFASSGIELSHELMKDIASKLPECNLSEIVIIVIELSCTSDEIIHEYQDVFYSQNYRIEIDTLKENLKGLRISKCQQL